jgi:hypothetical protein
LVPSKCSFEIEVISPMNTASLVVFRWRQAQSHLLHSRCVSHRYEEAAIDLHAVNGEGVDLIGRVQTTNKPVAISPSAAGAGDQDIAVSRRPLTLNTPKLSAQVEDQVVSATFCKRPKHVHSEEGCPQRDRHLRDRSPSDPLSYETTYQSPRLGRVRLGHPRAGLQSRRSHKGRTNL